MTSTSGADGLTRDAFLGGTVMAWQPRKGFRAGLDTVLLAAAVEAQAGQSVLELGCGAGIASLCLMARVPGLSVTGVEVQPQYAALAVRNAPGGFRAVEADLAELPADLRNQSFHHVMMNPPYFDRAASIASPHRGRDMAFGGGTPLGDWIAQAARRLRPHGWMTLIQKAERLPEILAACDGRMGSVAVRPVTGRAGRDADRILLRAKKDGRAAFRLMAPLILHEGGRHLSDAEDFRPEVAALLRAPVALGWDD
jgi:tRNA1(Val) A37 N6-methylase TrmN6